MRTLGAKPPAQALEPPQAKASGVLGELRESGPASTGRGGGSSSATATPPLLGRSAGADPSSATDGSVELRASAVPSRTSGIALQGAPTAPRRASCEAFNDREGAGAEARPGPGAELSRALPERPSQQRARPGTRPHSSRSEARRPVTQSLCRRRPGWPPIPPKAPVTPPRGRRGSVARYRQDPRVPASPPRDHPLRLGPASPCAPVAPKGGPRRPRSRPRPALRRCPLGPPPVLPNPGRTRSGSERRAPQEPARLEAGTGHGGRRWVRQVIRQLTQPSLSPLLSNTCTPCLGASPHRRGYRAPVFPQSATNLVLARGRPASPFGVNQDDHSRQHVPRRGQFHRVSRFETGPETGSRTSDRPYAAVTKRLCRCATTFVLRDVASRHAAARAFVTFRALL